jgi:hypothetical protein
MMRGCGGAVRGEAGEGGSECGHGLSEWYTRVTD